jgi:hypothetical protein
VKFKSFKDNYHKHPDVRLKSLAKIKEVYLEQQSKELAKNLQREVESMSPSKVADKDISPSKYGIHTTQTRE